MKRKKEKNHVANLKYTQKVILVKKIFCLFSVLNLKKENITEKIIKNNKIVG
jgi:uncharacterized protein (DUF486 family)